MVVVGLQRVAQLAFFYRLEAPLLIETHFLCCVIAEHNGAHLIQTAQSPFLSLLQSYFLHSQPKQAMF